MVTQNVMWGLGSMPIFNCKIATPSGRILEKRMIGQSKATVKEQLEKEGNFVLHIKRAEGILPAVGLIGSGKGIKLKDLIIFNQEFSVLLKAGLPIPAALDAIIEKAKEGELIDILRDIRGEVAGGAALSTAFSKYQDIFSSLYIAALQAGEKTGNIALALSRHVQYLKKIDQIRRKVISASVYPMILTAVSLAALLFLLLYVVPTFTRTYFEAGAELPGLTRLLLAFTTAFKAKALYIGVAVALCLVLYFYLKSTKKGRRFMDRWKILLPIIGPVYLHYSVSKLSRTLATVLGAGMPLLEAVRISTGVLKNTFIKERLDRVGKELERGGGFAEALAASGVFPSLAVRMISAGENSGSLGQVLNDLAEFYEEDVNTRLAVLTSAIEPTLMIVMGALIGLVVLAMYLPIFQLASVAI